MSLEDIPDGELPGMWERADFIDTRDEPVCRTCGERYPDAGDGWDGECGNCADITAQAQNGDY